MPAIESSTHGIVCETLDVGAKVTLRGRRRRHRPGQPLPLDTLPDAWRKLLLRWAKRGFRCKWETLLKDAGSAQVETSHALLERLLRCGHAAVEEIRKPGGLWTALWVEFPHASILRRELGMADPAEVEEAWKITRQAVFSDETLQAAALSLDKRPPHIALARHGLLAALANWQEEGRYGTRRDFAQTARGDTKGITTAEWEWLENTIPLADYGVERHTPLLMLRAPLVLETPGGPISLGAAPDFIALSADTIGSATAVSGQIENWRLVENRTSFERAARQSGYQDGVAWLPGVPPTWWKEAMAKLLKLQPAPALIACDPDPAGIEIALAAGELWQSCGLDWYPWKMEAASLAALPRRKPLSERDIQRLAWLSGITLPPALSGLAQWMREHHEKGEQEGLL